MASIPLDAKPKERPINLVDNSVTTKSPRRAEEDAIAVALLTGQPVRPIQEAIEAGNRTVITATKRETSGPSTSNFQQIAESAYREGQDPADTVAMMEDEGEKRRQFYSSGDNLYLEQALAIGDPTISADTTRFATNLQIGQEVFERELAAIQEDTGWGGYAADFFDRYFLRAFPIGAVESITNRPERKGQELLEAALTMDPVEYETFITAYVEELKNEGVLVSDNMFALADGMSELRNAGFDEHEVFNRLVGVAELSPLAGVARLGAATSPIRRVAALKGPRAAADAGETLVAKAENPKPRDVADVKPEAVDPGAPAAVKVPVNRDVQITRENQIIREVQDVTSRGALGTGVDATPAVRAYEELVNTFRKATNNRIVNLERAVSPDATGNLNVNLLVGTVKSGNPYRTQRAAEKAAATIRAKDFPTAKAVPVDKEDLSKGFYVKVDEVLDPFDKVDEINTNQELDALRSVYARLVGSKAVNEDTVLNTMATQAEGVVSAIGGGRAMKEITRALESVPTEQRRVISRVFSDLRDGKDAFMREHYTDAEFANKYKANHPRGEFPTQREIDAFNAARSVNDAAYMLRAHNRMQKYIRNNYYAVTMPDGMRVPARITDEALGDEQIFDVSQGTLFTRKELRKDTKVWELDRELEGGIRYVVNPSDVSALSHGDVLGYNAGGRRINPEANYFVTLGDDSPRAFLTTTSEKEAQEAVAQISRIKAAADEAGDISTSSSKLDEVVAANNDWNPELQTWEEFTEFAKSRNLDFKKTVAFKSRDGEIRTGETRDFFSTTWDEYVTHDLNRADDVLTHYGGQEALNYDPINAMFRDFGSVTQHFAYNAYTQTALNSWLKAARRKGSGWEVPQTNDPVRAFNDAKQVEATNRTATNLGRQHRIISGRMGQRSEVFQRMEEYGAQVQEWVHDKASLKVSRDPARGVANSLLSIAHQSAFGFGNAAQFFVQGYHALTIAAMTQKSLVEAGSGLKALAMAPATRLILLGAKDAATEAEGIRRLAKWAGQSVDEMTETIDYIRTSGRDVLDGTMLEQGTGAQWGVSGWKGEGFLPSQLNDAKTSLMRGGKTALDAGLVPFTEGERMSRLTGLNAAILEYRATFPGQTLNSVHARDWITRREQALSFRMTNVNRAFIQEGIGKLPTQWFSYTLRAMESVAIGRDLTVGERARLFTALFPAFGLTGMGAASATDWLAEKIGAEPAGQAYTFIKRGMLDFLIEGMTGGEIELALAERLAPITLLQDVYRNIEGQKAPWEVALGPSGDIFSNIITQVINTGGEVVNGHSVSMTEDLIRTARQFSGVDNVFKAYGMYTNGSYRSRTGKTLPFEMDASDAVGQLLGFSPREVSEWYQEKQWAYNDSRKVKDLQTELESDFSRAMEMWDNNEEDRALKYIREIEHKIVLSGLSEYDQTRLRRSLRRTVDTSVYRMIMDHYRRENDYRAEVLENQLGDN